MNCQNHPEDGAEARCAGCAEPFCKNCLVTVHGQTYCGSCKTMAVKRTTMPEEMTVFNRNAKEAVWFALGSMIICGVIFAIMALVRANSARTEIANDKRQVGTGATWGAILIAVTVLIINALSWGNKRS